MMASFEVWSKREQLCLVSAVSCNGEQNWMNVSRSLKLLCGNIHSSEKFSQNPCAVKYGELFERSEKQKRKKCSASDSVPNIVNIVETPLEYVLGRLTEERIQELKSEIRNEQEIFAKLYTDVVHLQTGNSNEEQIRAMWMEIEREKAFDSNDNFQKRAAGQIGLNKNGHQGNDQQSYYEQKQHQQLKPVDQKPNQDTNKICKQHGTSPLLSSLLKSSSPAPSTTTSIARVNAPTITNLLTGVVSTSSKNCILPYTSDISSVSVSKSISGFRPCEKIQNTLQSALSPSQSAPTLSMLLENKKLSLEDLHEANKNLVESELLDEQSGHREAINNVEPIEDGSMTPTKEEEKQLMEVFNNLMPENIDELADILTNNQGILNQEILQEGSVLEVVESLIEETEEVDKEGIVLKTVENSLELSKEHQNDKNLKISMDGIKLKGERYSEDEYQQITHDGCVENETSSKTNQVKILKLDKGIKSRAKQDVDEEIQLEELYEEKIQKQEANEFAVLGDDEDEGVENTKIYPPLSLERRKDSVSDCSDVILIPTDDESNEVKLKKNTTENSPDPVIKEELLNKIVEENIKQNEIESVISEKSISSIYLADTEDDSSQPTACKDHSSHFLPNKKIDFQNEIPSKEQLKPSLITAVRKLRDRDRSESPLVDDDKNEHSTTQRLRRRYSSTNLHDSFPNWFPSDDDRESKVSKKFLMAVYNNLLKKKNASIFLRPITDEENELFKQVCRRPIDFQIIKRHIEDGTIRNATDFQRDLFLMCQNVILTFAANSSYVIMAKDLMIDFVNLRGQIIDVNIEKMLSFTNAQYTAGVKVRGSSRKCHKIP